jgi:hypothetical protein
MARDARDYQVIVHVLLDLNDTKWRYTLKRKRIGLGVGKLVMDLAMLRHR